MMKQMLPSGIRTVLVLSFLMGTLLLSSPVLAQSKGGSNVVRLTTGKNNKGFVIRGRIQKPQAFYILSRSSFNYKAVRRKEDLIKKVINAVKKRPF